MPRLAFALALLVACPSQQRTANTAVESSTPALLEVAPAPSPRVELPKSFVAFQKPIAERFGTSPNRRAALVLDKPLYRPGETIWLSALDLDLPSFAARTDRTFARIDLVDPRGSVAQEQFVAQSEGRAATAFDLPADVVGGRWLVRVIRGDDVLVERPIMISAFESPRIKKKLEFVRDAYGPGDEVTATVTLARATGEPLSEHAIEGRIRIDGVDLDAVTARTDAEGNAQIRFIVPASTEVGDGMLTVMIEDGGMTEGINRRVPIVTGHVALSLYPEGGELVSGLLSRVYVEAKDVLGEPADVAGVVRDDLGKEVASFRSVREGLGRFSLTPEAGRSYTLVLTEPAGTKVTAELPAAASSGCVLRTYDDLEGTADAIRASVRCTMARTVVLQASLREQILDTAALEVTPGTESVAWLTPQGAAATAQGVARVTLFDGATPLAERVVFRHRTSGLQIKIAARRERVTPRSAVDVDITATDASGAPVQAKLALSVVDDTVLQYADDEHGDLVAALLLHPELPEPVREPERYLAANDPEAALALDLLLGTRGWRRFDWVAAAAPLPDDPEAYRFVPVQEEMVFGGAGGGLGIHRERAQIAADIPAMPPEEDVMVMPVEVAAPAAAEPPPPPDAGPIAADFLQRIPAGRVFEAALREVEDGEMRWNPNMGGAEALTLVEARIFPTPAPDPSYEGPRTDFRDTIYWNPDAATDASGHATISFPVSDAVTSFRISADGVGAGLVGHGSAVISSALPFSLAVKLPAAVTEGDRIELPLMLANETDRAVNIVLDAQFGEGLALVDASPSGKLTLPASGRDARFAVLDVTGAQGLASVALSARGSGLSDRMERTLTLSARGFPRSFSASGQAKGLQRFTVDTTDARPGSVSGELTLFPSPLSSLVTGLDGMLQEPSGCFEQTSSTNYPNVMVLRYLESHDAVSPEIADRARGLIERGYAKLAGYETQEKGYEWFGSIPPHEALTAYGLVEFMDMKHVYSKVDDKMIDRTAKYLLSRRDGHGGYLRDSQQLDSFGAASPEVTDAYITWSLSRAGMAPQIEAEIARSREIASKSGDVYLLALAADTLLRTDRPAGQAAIDRLVALQDGDGGFTKADHSITRSGGDNLAAESTSLAVMALLEDGRHPVPLRDAVAWLDGHRTGWGTWGATQATVLSLQALTSYAEHTRATVSAGTVTVRIDGQIIATRRYEAGETGPISLPDLGTALAPGKHTVELLHDAEEPMPFSLGVNWRTERPQGEPSPIIGLSTSIDKTEADMGDTVRVTATVTNKSAEGQPMTVARVGLPAGASAQPWQLEELRRTGKVDFIETGTNEVVLYWRALPPKAEHIVALDLIADVPGRYTGQASSAWLYYDDTLRTWVDPVAVQIRR